ncbi:MAG TPA: DciA family protein [Tepidisphaeraceae bacterium]|nr:DciA family protein [Tepidisphaeraceae bacterium]
MNLSRESKSRVEEAELRRLAAVKTRQAAVTEPLGAELVSFFKQSAHKRQRKLEKIAAAWETLVPQMFSEHCALEGLHRGTLTVIVDSASHLYELKHLLIAGLEKQLLLACRSAGLSKIVLKAGRWYDERREARF